MLGTVAGRPNINQILQSDSGCTECTMDAGPTNMASTLIPVIIGLVTRQGSDRSITDVSSPCGGGLEWNGAVKAKSV
jgi:hypothetical protein